MPTHIPTYQRIKEVLRTEIENGQFQPHQRFVTQQEVCVRFGVSRITADRAINELVSDGLVYRRRGHGTYVYAQPVAGAVDLVRAPERDTIACVMSYIHSGHSLALMKGVERMCRETDHPFLLFNSDESVETERQNVQRAREAGVSGLIVYPVDGFNNADYFTSIQHEGMPMVMVDRYYPMIPTDIIVPDNVDAGYQVTRHLLARGHRHIGILWSDINCTSVQERLIGYRRALQEAQVPIEPELSALRHYYFLAETDRLAILSQWRSLVDPPTAIIASNGRVMMRLVQDLMTLTGEMGAETTLANLDSTDPEIIVPFAEVQTLLPSFAMGYQAAQLLINRLGGHDHSPPQHRIMPVTLAYPLRFIISRPAAVS